MRKTIYAVEITLTEITADFDEFGLVQGNTRDSRKVHAHYDGSRPKDEAEALYAACDALFESGGVAASPSPQR